MTESQLLKCISKVTGIPMTRIVMPLNHIPTKRTECDARALGVLAAKSVWPDCPVCRLGRFLGLSNGGSALALARANDRFLKDKSFRHLAVLLFEAIQSKNLVLPSNTH